MLASYLPTILSAKKIFLKRTSLLSSIFCLLLWVDIVNAAAQFAPLPATSNTGVYTVSWSGARQFAWINERAYIAGAWVDTMPMQVGPSGSIPMTKTQSGIYTYSLRDCYNTGGPPNGNPVCTPAGGFMIEVILPVPSVTASFSPATINESGTATLSWSSTLTTNCSATGISGVSGKSGSVNYVAPTVMSSNRIVNIPVTCTGGGGTISTTASVNVNWINDAPTISSITNRTINEDASTGAIAFTVNDEETPPGSLVVTATSSNTSLVPNGSLVLGGSGANRTIAVTPAANAHGSANITVKVTDANGASAQRLFTVTVNPVNDAPTISTLPHITIDENKDTGVRSFTIGDAETAAGSLTVTATSNNTVLVPNSNIASGGSGSARNIKVTPLENRDGSATITVTVSDGSLIATKSFILTVNDLPAKFIAIPSTSSNGVYNIAWSGAKQFAWVNERAYIAGAWVDSMPMQVGPSGSIPMNKTLNGIYTYSLRDCYNTGGPPNGNPVCTQTDGISVDVNFPAPVITANFSPATISEGGSSTLSWSVANALSCSATGMSGVSGVSGTTGYTASSVMSSNQTVNAVFTCIGQGPSTSTKTISLPITAVNDLPTISVIPHQSIQEDQAGGTGLISFTVADEETPAGSLTVTAASNNTTLIPNANISLGGSGANRTIRVTPAANTFGSAVISVVVSDGQQSASRTFNVTVASVNDLPSISNIPDQRVNAGASTPTLNFTIGDIETPATSLGVTVASDKPGLVAASGIALAGSGSSRTLKVTPVAGQSGLATITVNVTDANGGVTSKNVKVSVIADTNTPFDFDDAPAEFKFSLAGGLANLGSGQFVATTQGNLSVENGTTSYSVAIDLPPAVRDLAPKLALNYSSRGGDGVMGVGWSLSGLSSIQRCSASFAEEGAQAQKSNPRYSKGDRLCLDGQKLEIASSWSPASDSNYWASGAEYQTEVDSFATIKAYGSHNGAHQYFVVNTKDGRTLTFGREQNGQNSRIYAPGQPNGPINKWALDKAEDRYGNEYLVHYLRDTAKGEYYPSHITWEPESAVVFSYIDRTGKTPWGYDAGHKYERTKLLDKVTTYISVSNSSAPTGGTKVKEYDVKHQLSSTTGRHLVEEIQECGFNSTGTRQCAKPIKFEWQLGELGFEDTARPRSFAGMLYDDVNNDGYVDVVGEKSLLAWGNANGTFTAASYAEAELFYLIQTQQGKAAITGVHRTVGTENYLDIRLSRMSRSTAMTTQLITALLRRDTNEPSVQVADLNNDGLTDIIIQPIVSPSGSQFWIQQANGTFVKSNMVGARHNGAEISYLDINNDGLNDQTYVHFFGDAQSNTKNWFIAHANMIDHFSGEISRVEVSGTSPVVSIPGTAGGVGAYQRYGNNVGLWRTLIDINGDSSTDLLYQRTVAPYNWVVRLSTADAQSFENTPLIDTEIPVIPMAHGTAGQHVFVMDYNKDGLDDFIVFSGARYAWNMRVFFARYVNGNLQFINGDVDPFKNHLIHLATYLIAPGSNVINPMRGDVNNDGLTDMVFTTSEGYFYYAAKQQQPDLLKKVTDGFGAESELSYSPLTGDDNNGKPLYTPDAVPPIFPQAPVDRSMQVVKRASFNNGIGGQVHTYYHYTGGKQDLQGRGFLGFARIETTSTSDGVETRTDYRQDYPFIGRVSELLVKDSVSGNLISHTKNQFATHSSNSRFHYLDYSIEQSYQLLTTLQSNPLGTSKLQNSFDACGNLVGRTTTVGTSLSGSNVTGVLNTTTLVNTIPNAGNADCSDDFVTETTVTASDGLESRSATSTFEPNAQFDVAEQTAFAGTAMAVTTTTNRNDDGVVTGSSSIASDLGGATTAARSSQFSDFEQGIYPATLTNAKGHSATVSYDYRFGKVNQEADANGLISSRVYDVLGRNVRETAADGTVTELLSFYCSSAPVTCPANGAYLVATRITNPAESGKLGAPLSITYYDKLQRVIRTEAYSLDQTVVKVDTNYNAKGQLLRVSEPYIASATHYTTYSNYDALGRPNTVTGPDGGSITRSYSRAGSLLNTTETVTVVSPNGNGTQVTNRYTNALGQITKVEDAEGTPVDYTYDAQGNLKTTIVDNNSLTTITVEHDVAGNKTQITDPDAGVIGFAYNGFGELRRQTWQPNLSGYTKSITYTYDVLGRKTGRTDQPASGSAINYAWNWDAPNQLGLLSSQSGNGFTESYGYDHLSRLQTQTTTISGLSGSRIFTHGYDNFSRPTTTTYPNGLSITRDYQAAGIHVRTRDVTSGTNKTLWALGNTANDRGQLTQVLYGNGVVTEHAYEQNNGRLASITTGRLTASNTINNLNGDIQALSYSFDSLGNMYSRTTQRTDNNGLSFENTTESFAYDELNRVKTSTTSGLFSRFKDYDYDALGNLISRTDTGALNYSNNNAGVHAVTSSGVSGTPGYRTYQYDKYGNMTERGGEAITYDVFNKPLTISGSNGTTNFSYGPNHERFKQVSGSKTTFVINGGAYEEIVVSGTTTQKSYVDGFMVQTKTGATTEVTYLHKDHLGSTEAMTDVNGNLINRMSFDVWGERQQANWQTGTPGIGELNGFKTTKGYTGHEQLDAHKLIHMGGRVYDPALGRFLSADLFIQSPYNTQSFNRYSYVFNNPLSLIDPSGYYSDSFQWAMESSYQRSASFHWGASYQAAKSQEANLKLKKEAQKIYDENNSVLIDDWDDGVTADDFYYTGTSEDGTRSYDVVCAETCQRTAFIRSYMREMGLTPAQMMSTLKGLEYATYATGISGVIAKTGGKYVLKKNADDALETVVTKRGSFHEVLTEAPINGVTRRAHRDSANKSLANTLENDSEYAQAINKLLGTDVLKHMKSGKSGLKNPPGTEWHHPKGNPGVMQLLRRDVHRDQSLQDVLHTDRTGGFADHFKF